MLFVPVVLSCVFIQVFGLIFFQDWYLLNYELLVIFLPPLFLFLTEICRKSISLSSENVAFFNPLNCIFSF